MPEAVTLFQPVGNFCRREVITCAADDPLVTVGEIMRTRNISSVVVSDGSIPVGIVTDRDLRNKVVARGIDPGSLVVRDIMSAPLITVSEEEFLFEALYRMSKHGIHRVGVIDHDACLVGIITDSDILRLQTRSPQQLIREIEEAGCLDDLKALHNRVQGLVVHLVGTGVSSHDLGRLIAHLNDRILIRLITLLRATRFNDLAERFAFIVLGSEGRREQTLTTDQDNAIIYADDLEADELAKIEAFSHELIDGLIAIGVPPCPGGIMAKNREWRRSLSAWIEAVDHWLATPTSENILTGSMLFDLRTLYGDPSMEHALKEHITRQLLLEPMFLRYAAANVLRFRVPLGWFGRFQVEQQGDHRGQLDVKKAGIFSITEGIKVLALEAGIIGGGTSQRLAALVSAGVIDRSRADDLETCFNALVYFRLRSQVVAIREGRTPNNYIDLQHFTRTEKGRLKLALDGVETFQEFLKLRYSLDLLR
jgi:CBS domain-containing protein